MKPGPYRGSAPHNGTRTSKAAAVRQLGTRLTTRERVVDYVWACGAEGATRDQIAIALGLRLSSVCGRVAEEMAREPYDVRRIKQLPETRLTSAGAQAFVLVAVAPVDARQLGLLGEKGPDDSPRQRTQPKATPQGHGVNRRSRSAGARTVRKDTHVPAGAPESHAGTVVGLALF